MKIVVTGGRNFTDDERIAADVRALRGMMKLERLAHGDAPGADRLAHQAALAAGVDVGAYQVDRKLDGKWPAAGPRRNARMLEAERPELVLAYPDPLSRGTWHCVAYALSRGAIVIAWAPDFEVYTFLGGGAAAGVYVDRRGNGSCVMRLPVTVDLYDDRPGSPRYLMWPATASGDEVEVLADRGWQLLEALGGTA